MSTAAFRPGSCDAPRVMMLTTPAGTMSLINSANFSVVSGVNGEGLSTMVQPAAIAGATAQGCYAMMVLYGLAGAVLLAAMLFWSALSGLILMALGLAVTSLVEDMFARAPWLGTIGLAFASIAGFARELGCLA